MVLDARDPQEFAAGHLRGSLNVPADGRFAETAGMVLTPDQEVVVIAPQDREEEVIVRLARIGFDRVARLPARPGGRLPRNARTGRPGQPVHRGRAARDASRIPCRRSWSTSATLGELADGVIEGALEIPLAELPTRMTEIPRGARSSSTATAAAVLHRAPACSAPPATATSPT